MSRENHSTEVPVTGDPVVDELLRVLDGIDPHTSPEQHLPALTAVHEALQQRLSSAVE